MSVTMEDSASAKWVYIGKGSEPTKKQIKKADRVLKKITKGEPMKVIF